MQCSESPGIGDLLRWAEFAGSHGCRGLRVSLTCSLCDGSLRGVSVVSGQRSWSLLGLRGQSDCRGDLVGVVKLVWLAGNYEN